MRGWSRGLALAAAIGLAGCTVGPDYRAPDITLPAHFDAATTPRLKASDAGPPAIDLQVWWRALGDRELDSLIDRAIASNLDIEIALARLQEARTEEAVALGRALPEAAAAGAGGLGTGSDLSRGSVPSGLAAADNRTGLAHIGSVVGFDAEWQLDLFGQYRREIEAVRADAAAAAAARSAVLIAVVSDVARAYVDLRGLEMQLAVLHRNLLVARRTLDLTRARFARGLTNELDVTLAEREWATLAAEVAPAQAQITAARDTIATLLGRYPPDLAAELAAPAAMPRLPEAISPGLPLELLRRRPDLQQAERQLAGATARIGVATAALFPRFALGGGVGYQAENRGSLPSKGIWSAGPSAYWPLLDFGTLDALVDIADLQTRQRLLQYRQDILVAVQEVDTAIAGYAAQQERLRRLGEALAASLRAVSLASQRYDRGLTDFLYVLDAERQEYSLESQYALAEQAAAEQFVALYRSLGGGWEHYQSVPPIRTPEPAVIAAFHRLLAPEAPR